MRNSNRAYYDSLANKKPKTTHCQRAYSMRSTDQYGYKPAWNMRERGVARWSKKIKIPVDSSVTLLAKAPGAYASTTSAKAM
jgi:hypothetical protein